MSVKLNISKLERDYAGQYDYDNEFVPELQNAGAVISREEIDGDTYMVIDGLDTQEIMNILSGLLIDDNAEDYTIIDQAPAATEIIDPAENVAECNGNDCNPDFVEECDEDFIGESDDEYASIVVDFDALNEDAKPVSKPAKPASKHTAVPGVDFPLYENVRSQHMSTNRINDFDDDRELNEAFKGISKPANKKGGCCPPNGGRLRSLNEALKARDEKQQGKLDKSVKSIEDIIKSVKNTTIGKHEAAEAIAKLKKEQRVLKAIEGEDGKHFGVEDVRGVKGALTTIANTSEENAKEVEKLKAMKEKVENALRNRQTYLYENVTINGRNLKDATLEGLNKLLTATIKAKTQLTGKLTNAINESADTTGLKATLSKQTKLIEILENEIAYRLAAAKRFAELNEEDGFEAGTSGGSFTDDDLKNMFGNIEEPAKSEEGGEKKEGEEKSEEGSEEGSEEHKEEGSEEKSDEGTEEVELSTISITLPNMEAAEELKQLCVDAGIPEDALEIEEAGEEEKSEEGSEEHKEGESTEGSEGGEQSAEGGEQQPTEGGETPNESLRNNPNLKKLLEDEESGEQSAEGGEQSAEEGGEEKSEEGEEKEVHVILTNTDYVDKLAQVLKDSYAISNEEFQEMIGGELVNTEEGEEKSEEKSEEGSEEHKEEKSEEGEEKVSTDDLNNLFQGL